jgi:hypothetical protein
MENSNIENYGYVSEFNFYSNNRHFREYLPNIQIIRLKECLTYYWNYRGRKHFYTITSEFIQKKIQYVLEHKSMIDCLKDNYLFTKFQAVQAANVEAATTCSTSIIEKKKKRRKKKLDRKNAVPTGVKFIVLYVELCDEIVSIYNKSRKTILDSEYSYFNSMMREKYDNEYCIYEFTHLFERKNGNSRHPKTERGYFKIYISNYFNIYCEIKNFNGLILINRKRSNFNGVDLPIYFENGKTIQFKNNNKFILDNHSIDLIKRCGIKTEEKKEGNTTKYLFQFNFNQKSLLKRKESQIMNDTFLSKTIETNKKLMDKNRILNEENERIKKENERIKKENINIVEEFKIRERKLLEETSNREKKLNSKEQILLKNIESNKINQNKEKLKIIQVHKILSKMKNDLEKEKNDLEKEKNNLEREKNNLEREKNKLLSENENIIDKLLGN